MKFVDEAVIKVQAGNGGPGCKHFHREKFVPLGGPDGGNGGNGGSIILLADRNKNTLLDFHFQPKFKAQNGKKGEPAGRDGKSGEDLIIRVPVGTQVFKEPADRPPSGTPLADLCREGETCILAKGGRGGKGNAFFKSATNRTPEQHQPGEKGESGTFRLSLKLVADVGLIGLPNAGKSTLISRISAARPKIADYPFTTLSPNLGVAVAPGGRSFVVADIPGLIPGAHLGKGLGIRFLKHIERTKVLAHLIDPTQVDEKGKPLQVEQAFAQINEELKSFSSELLNRPQIVVLTKLDLIPTGESNEEVLRNFRRQGYTALAISSVTGQGLPELLNALAEAISRT